MKRMRSSGSPDEYQPARPDAGATPAAPLRRSARHASSSVASTNQAPTLSQLGSIGYVNNELNFYLPELEEYSAQQQFGHSDVGHSQQLHHMHQYDLRDLSTQQGYGSAREEAPAATVEKKPPKRSRQVSDNVIGQGKMLGTDEPDRDSENEDEEVADLNERLQDDLKPKVDEIHRRPPMLRVHISTIDPSTEICNDPKCFWKDNPGPFLRCIELSHIYELRPLSDSVSEISRNRPAQAWVNDVLETIAGTTPLNKPGIIPENNDSSEFALDALTAQTIDQEISRKGQYEKLHIPPTDGLPAAVKETIQDRLDPSGTTFVMFEVTKSTAQHIEQHRNSFQRAIEQLGERTFSRTKEVQNNDYDLRRWIASMELFGAMDYGDFILNTFRLFKQFTSLAWVQHSGISPASTLSKEDAEGLNEQQRRQHVQEGALHKLEQLLAKLEPDKCASKDELKKFLELRKSDTELFKRAAAITAAQLVFLQQRAASFGQEPKSFKRELEKQLRDLTKLTQENKSAVLRLTKLDTNQQSLLFPSATMAARKNNVSAHEKKSQKGKASDETQAIAGLSTASAPFFPEESPQPAINVRQGGPKTRGFIHVQVGSTQKSKAPRRQIKNFQRTFNPIDGTLFGDPSGAQESEKSIDIPVEPSSLRPSYNINPSTEVTSTSNWQDFGPEQNDMSKYHSSSNNIPLGPALTSMAKPFKLPQLSPQTYNASYSGLPGPQNFGYPQTHSERRPNELPNSFTGSFGRVETFDSTNNSRVSMESQLNRIGSLSHFNPQSQFRSRGTNSIIAPQALQQSGDQQEAYDRRIRQQYRYQQEDIQSGETEPRDTYGTGGLSGTLDYATAIDSQLNRGENSGHASQQSNDSAIHYRNQTAGESRNESTSYNTGTVPQGQFSPDIDFSNPDLNESL